MQPQQSEPNKQKGFKINQLKLPKNRIQLIGPLLAVIVILVGGYLLWNNRHTGTNSYSYSYSKTNSYKLLGSQSGSGISVQKPTEIGTSGSSAQGANQISFNHKITKNNKSVVAAQLSMASVTTGSAYEATYLKNIDTMMGDSKNANHVNILMPVKNFVSQRVNPSYTITYSEPKAFTSSNIKQHGWYVEFTASASAKDQAAYPNLFGKVLIAPGKNTYYYFMLDSLTINWSKNQKAWNDVLNSIKLDQ